MKSLKQLCTPRSSIFDASKRDTVLNLTHLVEDKIDGAEFFEESYVTDGMHTLLVEAFRRMQGKSGQAVFKLTQAMGGGKTHNLITLGMCKRRLKSAAGGTEWCGGRKVRHLQINHGGCSLICSNGPRYAAEF